MNKKHIVFFSGGIGSYWTAKRVAEKHGTDNLILLFTDTLIEDADLYRFLEEAAEDIGGELVWLKEGRDVWQIFFDERFLGNSRIDPCSKLLKRNMSKKYVKQFAPEDVVLYLGIDWTELHRHERAAKRWLPYKLEAPLCEKPYLSKNEMLGNCPIKVPRLYDLGFPHNNCGGFCIKAGQAHFKHLLHNLPEVYAYHENKEQEFREFIGRDVAILRKMHKGVKSPLTLKQLRGEDCDNSFDWGGCGCFLD